MLWERGRREESGIDKPKGQRIERRERGEGEAKRRVGKK